MMRVERPKTSGKSDPRTAREAEAAGLYVLGMNFQRRRNSSFIDGVGDDARMIAGHLAQLVAGRRVA